MRQAILLSTLSATLVSLVYPPQGTLVGRGDALRAQGADGAVVYGEVLDSKHQCAAPFPR